VPSFPASRRSVLINREGTPPTPNHQSTTFGNSSSEELDQHFQELDIHMYLPGVAPPSEATSQRSPDGTGTVNLKGPADWTLGDGVFLIFRWGSTIVTSSVPTTVAQELSFERAIIPRLP